MKLIILLTTIILALIALVAQRVVGEIWLLTARTLGRFSTCGEYFFFYLPVPEHRKYSPETIMSPPCQEAWILLLVQSAVMIFFTLTITLASKVTITTLITVHILNALATAAFFIHDIIKLIYLLYFKTQFEQILRNLKDEYINWLKPEQESEERKC